VVGGAHPCVLHPVLAVVGCGCNDRHRHRYRDRDRDRYRNRYRNRDRYRFRYRSCPNSCQILSRRVHWVSNCPPPYRFCKAYPFTGRVPQIMNFRIFNQMAGDALFTRRTNGYGFEEIDCDIDSDSDSDGDRSGFISHRPIDTPPDIRRRRPPPHHERFSKGAFQS
jgi:hypothetical protein